MLVLYCHPEVNISCLQLSALTGQPVEGSHASPMRFDLTLLLLAFTIQCDLASPTPTSSIIMMSG